MPEPASPCVGVCQYDERRGLCSGCLRALDEIAAWPTATPQLKAEILRRLEARRNGLAAAGGGAPS